jgi:hypothetical protein
MCDNLCCMQHTSAPAPVEAPRTQEAGGDSTRGALCRLCGGAGQKTRLWLLRCQRVVYRKKESRKRGWKDAILANTQ